MRRAEGTVLLLSALRMRGRGCTSGTDAFTFRQKGEIIRGIRLNTPPLETLSSILTSLIRLASFIH